MSRLPVPLQTIQPTSCGPGPRRAHVSTKRLVEKHRYRRRSSFRPPSFGALVPSAGSTCLAARSLTSFPTLRSPRTDTVPAAPEREYCEYTAVTEEEFMGVSEFVRGRCKLNDVNDVYKQLCCHFTELKSSKSVAGCACQVPQI